MPGDFALRNQDFAEHFNRILLPVNLAVEGFKIVLSTGTRQPVSTIILKSCGFHEANCSINLSSTGSDRYLDAKLNRFWRMHFI